MIAYGESAADRGLRVIIAGAGGAAHLPGMLAAVTPLPVIGVPVPLKHLDGMDSLLSIVQMPAGVPVATVSIGGARNAGLLAARILASGTDDEAAALRAADGAVPAGACATRPTPRASGCARAPPARPGRRRPGLSSVRRGRPAAESGGRPSHCRRSCRVRAAGRPRGGRSRTRSVAAGDGALRTWMTLSCCSRRKSSTS